MCLVQKQLLPPQMNMDLKKGFPQRSFLYTWFSSGSKANPCASMVSLVSHRLPIWIGQCCAPVCKCSIPASLPALAMQEFQCSRLPAVFQCSIQILGHPRCSQPFETQRWLLFGRPSGSQFHSAALQVEVLPRKVFWGLRKKEARRWRGRMLEGGVIIFV